MSTKKRSGRTILAKRSKQSSSILSPSKAKHLKARSNTTLEYSQSIKNQQHQQILQILTQRKFIDTTLIIGAERKQYKIHRLFLSSISTEFDELLYDDRKSDECTLSDIESIGFECILNYAYLNNPNLTDENVLSTIHICNMYKITSLLRVCDQYFDQIICGRNVLLFLNESVRLNLDEYTSKCLKYLKSHPKQIKAITNLNGFQKLNINAMILCLKMDEFAIDENTIWDKLLKWANYEDNDKNKHIIKYHKQCNESLIAGYIREFDIR